MKLDKDKRRGVIGTIIFHLILLITLLILALRTPLPLPGEEGVEVMLGFSDAGLGTTLPKSPAPATPPVPVTPTPPIEEVVEEVVTQNTEESITIPDLEPEKVEEKPEEEEITEEIIEEIVPEPEPIEETPPQPEVNQRALFRGSQSNSEEGGSSGITQGQGSQGRPDGLRDVQRYDGQGGQGDGPAYSLGGRGAKYLERPSSNFTEQGDVVVDIWVDRNGNVKRAEVSPRGTTILDANLRNIAVRAALNSTFNEDPRAPDLQKGSITYTFIIRR